MPPTVDELVVLDFRDKLIDLRRLRRSAEAIERELDRRSESLLGRVVSVRYNPVLMGLRRSEGAWKRLLGTNGEWSTMGVHPPQPTDVLCTGVVTNTWREGDSAFVSVVIPKKRHEYKIDLFHYLLDELDGFPGE